MSDTITSIVTVLGSGGLTVVINRVFNWLDKRHDAKVKEIEAAADRQRREAVAEATRDRLQSESEEWLRGKVDEMVENERATYAATLAAHTQTINELRASMLKMQSSLQNALNDVAERDARIAALEATLNEFPELIEQFVLIIAGIDRDKTPTPQQMTAMRDLARRMRLHERVPNRVLLAKVGP